MRCLAFFLILLPTTLVAQRAARLEGRIVDATTREPIAGATIWLEGTQIGTASDSTGTYRIESPPAGTFDVLASFIGHASTLLPRMSIRPSATMRLDVALVELEHPDCGIVVSEDDKQQTDPTVTVSGTVIDVLTGEPVVGAAVTFGESVAVSDGDGQYVADDLVMNEHSVIASAPGFYPVIYRRLDFCRDRALNFLLSRSAPGDSVETAK